MRGGLLQNIDPPSQDKPVSVMICWSSSSRLWNVPKWNLLINICTRCSMASDAKDKMLSWKMNIERKERIVWNLCLGLASFHKESEHRTFVTHISQSRNRTSRVVGDRIWNYVAPEQGLASRRNGNWTAIESCLELQLEKRTKWKEPTTGGKQTRLTKSEER